MKSFVWALVVATSSSSLWSDVRVDYSVDGSSFADISDGAVVGSDVTVNGAVGGIYRVYAVPVSESIGTVTVTAMGPNEAIDILIAAPPASGIDEDVLLPPGCTDLGNLSAPSGLVRVQISVLGNISGIVGDNPLFTNPDAAIIRCDTPGSIFGSIYHTSTTEDIALIDCGAFSGVVESMSRRIEFINCLSAFSGSVTARGEGAGADGSIGDITVVGTFSGSVTFQSTVDSIVAASFSPSSSVLRAGPNELASHGVGLIEALNGDLDGNFVFPRLRPASEVPNGNLIRTTGSMTTVMTLSNGIDTDALVQIGGSLSSIPDVLQAIELGDGAPGRLRLGGQIIINANNSGGAWNDFIRVNSDGVPSLYTLSDNGDGVYAVASTSVLTS